MVTDYRKEKKKCVMLLGSLVTVCFIRKEHPNTIPWRKVQSEPLLYIFTVLKLGINSHWCCNVEMCLYSKGGKDSVSVSLPITVSLCTHTNI